MSLVRRFSFIVLILLIIMAVTPAVAQEQPLPPPQETVRDVGNCPPKAWEMTATQFVRNGTDWELEVGTCAGNRNGVIVVRHVDGTRLRFPVSKGYDSTLIPLGEEHGGIAKLILRTPSAKKVILTSFPTCCPPTPCQTEFLGELIYQPVTDEYTVDFCTNPSANVLIVYHSNQYVHKINEAFFGAGQRVLPRKLIVGGLTYYLGAVNIWLGGIQTQRQTVCDKNLVIPAGYEEELSAYVASYCFLEPVTLAVGLIHESGLSYITETLPLVGMGTNVTAAEWHRESGKYAANAMIFTINRTGEVVASYQLGWGTGPEDRNMVDLLAPALALPPAN